MVFRSKGDADIASVGMVTTLLARITDWGMVIYF